VHSIWWNLVQNALKHGGPLPHVTIAWSREGDEFQFSVSDAGPGVLKAREAGLLSPFDQLHHLRYPGLGLSIVQRLVLLQGGHSHYQKLPERGSRFTFTLPAE
jgi:signal transduction histidine kinase